MRCPDAGLHPHVPLLTPRQGLYTGLGAGLGGLAGGLLYGAGAGLAAVADWAQWQLLSSECAPSLTPFPIPDF